MERPMSDFTTGRSLNHMVARSAAVESITMIIASTFGSFARRMREERTKRELMDLDDHLLHDIGLSRSDIRSGRFAELNRINWAGRGHPLGI
jgi:uncharacterized protein YjiS (DUF1127 family)